MARFTITMTKTQRESFSLEAESQEEASRLANELFDRDYVLSYWVEERMGEFYDPDWDITARPYEKGRDSWLTPAEEIEGLLD